MNDKVTELKPRKNDGQENVVIQGAHLISGENVIGRRVKGGLRDLLIMAMNPQKDDKGGSSLQVIMLPFRPPIFLHEGKGAEVNDRHIMQRYTLPPEVIDHYWSRMTGFSISQKPKDKEE